MNKDITFRLELLSIGRVATVMEKFMYKQKLHYLAIIWGSLVLIAAGSALLFPDIMAKLIPGTLGKLLPQGAIGEESYSAFFQALARLMHADEAVMALIVVAFWHWSKSGWARVC